MGGGGGSPQPTSTTTQTSNIPEYARPYVETMLGATQQQLFNTKQTQTGTDESGNPIYSTDITGVKPYVPYSENPQDYVAGFSPLQQQAQQGVAGLGVPSEYGTAAGLTGMSTLGAMGAGRDYQRMATNPYSVGAYMNPYIQQALQPQLNQIAEQGAIQAQQAAGQATAAGAFGGTRSALQQNLAQRNALMAQQAALGQGYNQAFNQAQQAMQYGAGLGLQGQQAAMQGAGQLANIGGQALQAQQGILGLQNQYGTQQQQQEQNIINQAVQNYATAQQYPQQQLAFMNAMIRGLPLQTMTTQGYQAAPSTFSQLGGLAATGLGAYGAMGGFRAAKGGQVKEKHYDVGGAVAADLESMDDAHLIQEAKTSPSVMIRKQAMQILAERKAAQGIEGAQSNLSFSDGGITEPQQDGDEYAGGGIIAFQNRGLVDDTYDEGIKQLTGDDLRRAKINYAMENADNPLAILNPGKLWDKTKGFFANVENQNALKRALASESSPVAQSLPAVTSKSSATETTTSAAPATSAKTEKPPVSTTAAEGSEDSGIDGLFSGKYGKLMGKSYKELTEADLGSQKAQSDLDTLRKEIEANKDQKLWQALMMGGAKAMSGTSPRALQNIGEGIAGGVSDYAKAEAAERADKKLLIQQQAALDQANYAKKSGNFNALLQAQTRLDNIEISRNQLAAQKELAMLSARDKAYGDLVHKLYVQTQDIDQAKAMADKIYAGSNLGGMPGMPEGVTVKKVK